ncbi:Peptidoglycan-N-acetylglucosamine deacetylase [Sporomusa silvacetica DSM 10669]|uniref:Peptidoglycan-N-acetylglucosamine deacetylase n=1 Tax=Sporomusa silvacetica DSM 10669 TaxID=1123289 RepID=A0ABZ3IM96_9FIRM|nr:polysaccharide deacetylase family protein [Sporomusa silvacetica]OZC15703.1 peptidoglycan-N-acetylmuramic acid deacetylase PdaC [Sporomusa silvacetica DSM 10669]
MKRHRFCLFFLVFSLTIAGLTQQYTSDDTQIISRVHTNKKVLALTIDDGPNNKVTPDILAVLREKNVKVTFFVLGTNANDFPSIVAQEVADNHEIGAHTYSHASLPNLSQQKVDEEFNKAEEVIQSIAPKPNLFRPPGGAYNHQIIETARQKGYTVILWSVDPKDWSCPPAEKVIDRVVNEAKPGSIILLHDGQYPLPTPKALGTIIDRLRERGFEFVTVSELLQYNETRPALNLFNKRELVQ